MGLRWRHALGARYLLTIGLTLLAIASAGLIGMALRVDSPLFRLGTLRPLRSLGKYSYGFYIYHYLFPFAWVKLLHWAGLRTGSLALAGLIETGSIFIVTYLVAKLSFDLFESRFLRWKSRFEYDVEQQSHRHAFISE